MEYDYRKLAPFKFFILQNFPFIEEDFDAITNYQLLCKLGEEINKIINSVNLIGEQAENLTNAYNALKDYVDNYFNNLDVQDEIDNKLDDMAEQGQLAEIIAQYLSVQAVLGFATIAEMSTAEYLVDGAYMRTYGNTTLNDGDGGFYFAREIQNTDVVDGYYIVALNDPDLVAVRCSDGRLDTIEGEIATLQGQVSFMNSKKVILIGDSYAQGYTQEGQTTSWQDLFITKTGLTNTIKKAYGGVGFVNTVDGKNFETLLEEISADNTITDIIVLGGYNDQQANYSTVNTAIASFVSEANSRFPNAKIYIGMCGWSTDSTKLYDLNNILCYYRRSAKNNNCNYLNGIEYSLHAYFSNFSSDGFHPNQNGQNEIANNLVEAWRNGVAYVSLPYTNITLTFDSNIQIGATGWDSVGCILSNNIVEVTKQGESTMRLVNGVTASSRNNTIKIGDITGGYIVGSHYGMDYIPCKMFIKSTEGYFNVYGQILFSDGQVWIKFGQITDDHSNYQTFTNITEIQISSFHGIFASEFC